MPVKAPRLALVRLLGAVSTLGSPDNPHVKHATKCGGCGLWFLGTDPQGSANLLKAHISLAPCEHYAHPTPLELRMRTDPLRQREDGPKDKTEEYRTIQCAQRFSPSKT